MNRFWILSYYCTKSYIKIDSFDSLFTSLLLLVWILPQLSHEGLVSYSQQCHAIVSMFLSSKVLFAMRSKQQNCVPNDPICFEIPENFKILEVILILNVLARFHCQENVLSDRIIHWKQSESSPCLITVCHFLKCKASRWMILTSRQ